MRSIGKKNVKLVQELAEGWLLDRDYNEDVIVGLIPDAMFDIWESADSEIRRIIRDVNADCNYSNCRIIKRINKK